MQAKLSPRALNKHVPLKMNLYYFGDSDSMNFLMKCGNCMDFSILNAVRKQNLRRIGWRSTLISVAFLTACIGVFAQNNVTTQHYDIARTGANTNETILP